ncbi:hypothetical protein [Bacillus inaquosorum]|uniref:hypothetical protein n=1 Tax=Bacillus inaquosorum TaxID=483913 RepID=UPI00228130E8|nr:hypothetical protein [Bacillus inaquosorum]MCY8850310.1 hypothetical protein [Bacillus inaquosorum]MCY8871074.1 hypothetical protein [Bacillus inaquosorum]
MKKVSFIIAFIGVLLVSSLYTPQVNAKEKGSISQNTNQVEYYDANGKLIDTENYSDGNVTTQSTQFSVMAVKASRISSYDFGPSTFSNFVWVKGGKAFKNPGAMSVELANRAKKFEVWMYSSNKKSYIGKGVVKNASGWVPFDWRPLRKKGSSYTFKLVNGSSGKIKVIGGTLEYNVN